MTRAARSPANRPALQRVEGFVYFALFCGCIPLANWLIGNVGTVCPPESPCLIPVWPGILAPSGVLAIGLALVLRDLVQRRLGLAWALGAIAVGAAFAGLVSPPALVLASVAAFVLSELADLTVYTPLQRRSLVLAVAASGVVGIAVDSVLFLSLAFGSFDFLAGQMIGKGWALVAALPVVHWLRTRDRRMGIGAT